MSWSWEIRTGRLYGDCGEIIATGYSGAPGHQNDVAAVALQNEGPIPAGTYTITEPRDTTDHGPYAMPLVPDPANQMFGRSAFLIHGDNVHHPGMASEGCIILPRSIREEVWNSGDHVLDVVIQLQEEEVTV